MRSVLSSENFFTDGFPLPAGSLVGGWLGKGREGDGSLQVKHADPVTRLSGQNCCASLAISSLPRSHHCSRLQPAAGVNLCHICNPQKERPSCDGAGLGAPRNGQRPRCQNEQHVTAHTSSRPPSEGSITAPWHLNLLLSLKPFLGSRGKRLDSEGSPRFPAGSATYKLGDFGLMTCLLQVSVSLP